MKSNIRKNMGISIFWVILGIALIVLSAMGMIDKSIFTGMGGGLIVVGVIQLIRNFRYLTDAKYQEKVDVEVGDERNHYLRMKAWSWAGYLYVILTAILTVVFTVLDKPQLMQFCSVSLACFVFLFWGSFMILRKKY